MKTNKALLSAVIAAWTNIIPVQASTSSIPEFDTEISENQSPTTTIADMFETLKPATQQRILAEPGVKVKLMISIFNAPISEEMQQMMLGSLSNDQLPSLFRTLPLEAKQYILGNSSAVKEQLGACIFSTTLPKKAQQILLAMPNEQLVSLYETLPSDTQQRILGDSAVKDKLKISIFKAPISGEMQQMMLGSLNNDQLFYLYNSLSPEQKEAVLNENSEEIRECSIYEGMKITPNAECVFDKMTTIPAGPWEIRFTSPLPSDISDRQILEAAIFYERNGDYFKDYWGNTDVFGHKYIKDGEIDYLEQPGHPIIIKLFSSIEGLIIEYAPFIKISKTRTKISCSPFIRYIDCAQKLTGILENACEQDGRYIYYYKTGKGRTVRDKQTGETMEFAEFLRKMYSLKHGK